VSWIAPVLIATITLIGSIVGTILNQRSKRLASDIAAETDVRKMLSEKVDSLEFQLMAAVKTIQNLEKALYDKEIAVRELGWRYESLKQQHDELLERYKASEASYNKLRDEWLGWYLKTDRKTLPPPPDYP
jgi:hypothetical protein